MHVYCMRHAYLLFLLVSDCTDTSTYIVTAKVSTSYTLHRQGAAKLHQKFHTDRDHAMRSIQNRSGPAVQLAQPENYPIRTFRALVFLKAHSNAECFITKWQHSNGGA
jgi:hypothetical protein